MRYILAIDTAAAEGSAALAADGAPRGDVRLAPGGHSEGLSRAAEQLLEGAGIAIGDLAAIAVAEGPGSFTGLRIGLAWAKGVAWGRSIPIVLVPSHEALARGRGAPARRIATMIPGERGRVETALWDFGPPLTLLWGPEPVDEEDLVERVESTVRATPAKGGEVGPTLLAPMNARIEAVLEEQLDSSMLSLAPPALLAPAVASIADHLLVAGKTAEWVSASPAYGRAPNARKPAS